MTTEAEYPETVLNCFTGDFNGDGITDVRCEDYTDALVMNTYRGRQHYLVSSVRNGFGRSSHFEYSALSNHTSYSINLFSR